MGKIYASGGNTNYRNLPSAYTQVEYIENNGFEYIDSGVVLSSSIKVEADFQITEKKYGYEIFVFGNFYGRDTSDNTVSRIRAGLIAEDEFQMIGTGSFSQTSNVFTRTTVTCTATSGSNVNNTTIYIFKGLRRLSSDSQLLIEGTGKLRLYSLKMYDSNVLIRDFVPCIRKIDSIRGLYDVVNDVFYTTTNTVPSAYQLVEYIERVSGSGYIATGFTVNSKTGSYITFSINNSIGSSNSGCAMGADDGDGVRYKLETWASETASTGGSFFIGTSYTAYNPMITPNEKITVSHSMTAKSVVARNDNTYVTTTKAPPNMTNEFYILSGNNEGNPIGNSGMKLYACYIYQEYDEVHTYIPVVRKSDSVAGLYDLKEGTFLTSATGGTFLYGDPITYFEETGPVVFQQVAHKVKNFYIGRDTGVAKKVKKVYIGDPNNIARLCFTDSQ